MSDRDAMIAALQSTSPPPRRNVPDGGFYVWVKLPEGLDSKSMLPRAVTARVPTWRARRSSWTGRGADHMRLSFCYPTPDRIREGVKRLATVVDADRDRADLWRSGERLAEPQLTSPHPTWLSKYPVRTRFNESQGLRRMAWTS